MTSLNRILVRCIMTLPLMLIPLLVSIWIITQYALSDSEYSFVVCANFIYLLAQIWFVSKKQITPMLLFFMTFSFLFMGGRFWAILLGLEFPLWTGTSFYKDYLNIERRTNLLIYLLTFSYSSVMGYIVCYRSYTRRNAQEIQRDIKNRINIILKYCFWIIAPLTLFQSVNKLILALQGGGYLSLYIDFQNGDYSSGIGQTLNRILFGFAMVFGNYEIRRNYLILFYISSIIMLLVGGRSSFGALLLFSLWLYSLSHKVNLGKLAMYGSVALALLLFIFQFSIRNADSMTYTNIFDLLLAFIYSQGISLFVFEYSTWFSYPFIPYIQVFIPGFATIYSYISGVKLSMPDVSFGQSLPFQLNPQLYFEGRGLGWTLMSDVYVFTCGSLLFFIVVSMGLGFLLGWIENRSKESPVYMVVLYTVFLRLMLLPRAELVGISVLSIYTCLIYFIILFSTRIRQFNH